MWINHYDEANDSFDFEPFGFVTGDANCTQGWGVGQHDLGMRFADIDGDGRADYLCIEYVSKTYFANYQDQEN